MRPRHGAVGPVTEGGPVAEMLIRVDGGPWREPSGTGYASESALQGLLADHPTLVPGLSADAVVCQQFQSGVGPADLVAVDGDGGLTLVECKLAANPQVRREVIGQVLDYASRLWRMPVADFDDQWARRTGESLFTTLADDDGQIRAAVEANLQDSRFRIVLAVDAINDDLRRIVEYLNAVTVPATGVVAVEFLRLHDGAVEILTPRSYGEELADSKETSDTGSQRPWTIEEYRDWMVNHDASTVPTLDALLLALTANGFSIGGGRAASPSLNVAIFIPRVGTKWPINLRVRDSIGAAIQMRFSDLSRFPDVADRFAVAVTSGSWCPLSLDEIRTAEYHKRPLVPMRALSPPDATTFASTLAKALTMDPP